MVFNATFNNISVISWRLEQLEVEIEYSAIVIYRNYSCSKVKLKFLFCIRR